MRILTFLDLDMSAALLRRPHANIASALLPDPSLQLHKSLKEKGFWDRCRKRYLYLNKRGEGGPRYRKGGATQGI